MPLVHPLSDEQMNEDLLERFQFFKGPLGTIPNSIRTMSHRPDIAVAFTQLNMAVMECHGKLSAELKRLIGYMSSATTGCLYCQAHTALAAQRFGSTEERFNDIWNYRESAHFNSAEKSAFDFAIAASSVPNAVDKDIVDNLHEHWDEGDIVEMMAVISLFGFLNRWNDSMATTLEELPKELAAKRMAEKGWAPGKHE